MKLFKTLIGDYFSWYDLLTIEFEETKAQLQIAYFHLKGGKKIEAADLPNSFTLENLEDDFYFNRDCAEEYIRLLIEDAFKFYYSDHKLMFGLVYEQQKNEEEIWSKFIDWAKGNRDKLQKRIVKKL